MILNDLGKKLDFVIGVLEELYFKTEVPLDHKDSYTLLIAVLLSAQCTDVRVNKVTPKLFSIADNPVDMSKVDYKEVQRVIRPCGLSERKARAIVELSRMLVHDYDGVVPSDFVSLQTFPGVGRKTAQVVMSQAFGIDEFPVDTHIHRLARRWGLSNGISVLQTERDLKSLFPKTRWSKLHLQMIFFGREHCGARTCDGKKCMICSVINERGW